MIPAAATGAGFGRRVVIGTALQSAARLVTAVTAFLILAVLARVLDREPFGRYGATLALFQVLDAFVDFGSLQAAVRCVARDPATARAAVRAAVRFRVLTAVISVGVTALAAWGLGDPDVVLVTVASLGFLSHAAGVSVAVLHADVRFGRSEAFRVLGSLLGLVGTLAFVSLGLRDAGSMLVVLFAGTSIANVALAFAVHADLPEGTADIDRRAFLHESITLGLGAVVRQSYYSMNPILARSLAGDEAAAEFIPAYRVSGFAILLSVYFGAAVLPALVKLRASDPARLPAFERGWALALAAIGLAVGGVLFLLRKPLLVLLFGSDYASSARVLGPMCITSGLIYVGGFALVRLVAAGRGRTALAVSVVGLAANLVANFALVPSMGAVGAAWSSVVTEGVVACGALLAIRRLRRDDARLAP